MTEEQLAEWLSHPVTREVMGEIRKTKEDLQAELGEGFYLKHEAYEASMTRYAQIVGQIVAFKEMLGITPEGFPNLKINSPEGKEEEWT